MPNWLGTCWADIASSMDWISDCGIDGLKTITFGPNDGPPDADATAGTTAPATPIKANNIATRMATVLRIYLSFARPRIPAPTLLHARPAAG